MKFTIYKITNNVNGKEYIGQHQTLDLTDDYMGSGKRLKYAQEYHGIENFSKEILFIFDNEEEMNAKEAELVTEEYCSRDDTYNIAPGGFGGGYRYINTNGLNNLNKDYEKISNKLKGRKNPHTTKWLKEQHKSGNISTATCGMLGKKHSEETKLKMSSSGSGKKNSQYGTVWITNGTINKKVKAIDIIPEGWYKGRSK